MGIPIPNLDDRRFQDLVDEAKRRVQQRCPEWSDHNVSDPGVTLIETFAFMVDQLIYRVNRIPERSYLRFLDLIGVTLFPPAAARVPATFRLSAPQENPVFVQAGSQVVTQRTEVSDPVVFTLEKTLEIRPCAWSRLATSSGDRPPVDRTDDVIDDRNPMLFGTTPQPDDTVYFGLSDAVPGGLLLLRMECQVEGVGIDPRDPPLAWEAWDGDRWAACEVAHDTTGGFNTAGDVELHLPETHTASVVGVHRAGWIRCRATAAEPGQPFYQASPTLRAITAATIGATGAAVHAEVVRDEVVGVSEGVPGQRFPLARRPVVAGDPLLVEIGTDQGWQEWTEVGSFADSGPDDRHFTVDRVAGEVVFGPAIRQPDGAFRYYGAVPAKAAAIRVPQYRTGGGRGGNVARGMLAVLRDPVPFVSGVTNHKPASGGVDGEKVGDAAIRGPLTLRTLDRAVTAHDYEELTRGASPQVSRVRCAQDPSSSNGVRVLVVPGIPDRGELDFGALKLPDRMRQDIARALEARRCLGARVVVEPPFYQGVTVVAQLRARPKVVADTLAARATEALHDYLNPVTGGPDGEGWPFGRPVQEGEMFAVLQQLTGVEMVESVLLFAADPVTGARGDNVKRIDIPPDALVFSYRHQVRVTRS
ncbi:putative baseplate assembly protein [Actinokineospora globicatena]|uniref:putative baseplate assembly protein n=1 Tax=Actinokineospora globicatena TaxID=103729 RepID=UPI0020A3B46F|nr:putative baseplate assembly protein [Actinokineospora globicatena]MCP2306427.1 putative baseplate assembly protein [Actinokineospora globicatena]GLW81851.1 putative baseplate assembly protein [Actinokineospora globicatena]GLW88645.1 putative baseplate assembly protein [Actinokineospora globicatena]